MALLPLMQMPGMQQNDDSADLLKLALLFAGMPSSAGAASGAAGATGAAAAAPAAVGSSAAAMPAIQGASAIPAASVMGPPTQLQGLLNQPTAAAQLGLPAGASSVASPAASLMPPAYNRPAAPMPQQQWTDASIAAQEAAIQAESDALQMGTAAPKQKMDLSKSMGLLGQMNKPEEQALLPTPQLSRGQAPQMQAGQSPLIAQQGGDVYSQMLQKMISGYYG